MSGSGECKLEGLCIKASPLGENDRLITILTDEQGIVRLAVPGARRPKSSLAAATPLTYLSLQIFGKRDLKSCLLYTSPSPRDGLLSRMPSSA